MSILFLVLVKFAEVVALIADVDVANRTGRTIAVIVGLVTVTSRVIITTMTAEAAIAIVTTIAVVATIAT